MKTFTPFLLSLFYSFTAVACPFCDTETAAQVRSGIFQDDFLPNLFAMLAPFPVLGLVVALVSRFE